jgi:hypothetical protein
MITVAPVIGATVCRRVGIVKPTITIWWPPIAASIGKNGSRGGAQDERAQISCCVVRRNRAVGIRGLGHIGHVINRRTRWNRVDLLRH